MDNKDGYGILKDDKLLRTLDKDEALKFINEKEPCKIMHCHFRMATSGKISQENVHLWKFDNVYFSHNGYVREYSNYNYPFRYYPFRYSYSYKEISTCDINESDSHLMFKSKDFLKHFNKLVKSVDKNTLRGVKALYTHLDNIGFYGIIMANDYRYVYVISNKKFNIYYHKGSVIFSNMPLYIGLTVKNGIQFQYHEEFCGVIIYDYISNKLVYMQEHMPKWSNYFGGDIYEY